MSGGGTLQRQHSSSSATGKQYGNLPNPQAQIQMVHPQMQHHQGQDQMDHMIPDGKQANGKPKQQKASICKICGKEGLANHVVKHIEATHLEGISLPCNICEKVFSSRNALCIHKSRLHRKV